MSKLQNADFASESEIVSSGGVASQLLNTSKIWEPSIGKTLDDAILDGDIGGGSGQGGINFITNGQFEEDTSGWTSGANFLITRNTTSPLRGTGDGKLSKDAANRQGQIVKAAFTIDNADKSKLLEISFSKNTSTNYIDNDIHVKIYDVVAAAYINSNPIELKAGSSDFFCMFQASTNTSYELHFVVSSVSALAYDIFIDEIIARPFSGTRVLGNGKQYDLTVTGTGWTTTRAVGYVYLSDNLKWRMAFNVRGAVTSATRSSYESTISGISLTESQSISSLTNSAAIATQSLIGTTGAMISYHTSSTTTLYIYSGDVELASKPTFVNEADFPQLLDLSTREVVTRAIKTSSQTVTVNPTKVTFTSISPSDSGFDIGGSFDTTNSKFTAPESGIYQVRIGAVMANYEATASAQLYIYKNNVSTVRQDVISAGVATTRLNLMNYTFNLSKGDFLELYVGSSDASYSVLGFSGLNNSQSFFEVNKLPRNQAAIISEKVVESWGDTSGQGIGSTQNALTFNTKYESTHGAFNGTTFTAPKSGMVYINLTVAAVITTAFNQGASIHLKKNGTEIRVQGVRGNTNIQNPTITTDIYVSRGDTITLEKYCDVAGNLTTSPTRNWVTFKMD